MYHKRNSIKPYETNSAFLSNNKNPYSETYNTYSSNTNQMTNFDFSFSNSKQTYDVPNKILDLGFSIANANSPKYKLPGNMTEKYSNTNQYQPLPEQQQQPPETSQYSPQIHSVGLQQPSERNYQLPVNVVTRYPSVINLFNNKVFVPKALQQGPPRKFLYDTLLQKIRSNSKISPHYNSAKYQGLDSLRPNYYKIPQNNHYPFQSFTPTPPKLTPRCKKTSDNKLHFERKVKILNCFLFLCRVIFVNNTI